MTCLRKIERKNQIIFATSLLTAGLILFVWQFFYHSMSGSNLLMNGDFNQLSLNGWEVQHMGNAKALVIPPQSDSESSQLALQIADSESDSWVGVGQRAVVRPLEPYRLSFDFRLLEPKQSSSRLVVRITQFDQKNVILNQDEFTLDIFVEDITGQTYTHQFVTTIQTAVVEIGVGLIGRQTTTVALDNFLLTASPVWWSELLYMPAVLLMIATGLVVLGYPTAVTLGHHLTVLFQRWAKSISLRGEIIIVSLLYTFITLIITYPVALKLNDVVAGAPNWDALPMVWYQWWIKQSLLNLQQWPSNITLLHWPLTVNHPLLAAHPFVPFISLPLTITLGPVVSYNLAVLMSFILSGISGYLLCRYLSCSAKAAFIGSLIFAFHPNRTGHAVAGHLLLIANYLLPLYALSLLLLLRRHSLKFAVWHGIVTGLLALAHPINIAYNIIPVFIFIGGSKLWGIIRNSPTRALRLKTIYWPGMANGLAAVIFLVFAWPLFTPTFTGYSAEGMASHSLDLLSFILPSPYNPILQQAGLTPSPLLLGIGEIHDLGEPLGYLGVIPLLLVLIALRHEKSAWTWVILSLATALLALGDELTIGGAKQGVTLPYSWLTTLPYINWSRTPARLITSMILGLAVLVSIGTAHLFKKIVQSNKKSIDWPLLITGIISAGILVEYVVIFPFPNEEIVVSDYYYQLTEAPANTGVLELPARTISNYAMFYQTIHQHPLAGGYVTRWPLGAAELRRFYHQFLWPWEDQQVFPPLDKETILAILNDMKIKHIIVHRPQTNLPRQTYIKELLGPPVYEDFEITAYELSENLKLKVARWTVIPDQKNWRVSREDGTALRMEPKGNLYIYAARQDSARLIIKIAADSSFQTDLHLTLNDQPIPYLSPPINGQFVFPLNLQKGFNYLRLVTIPPQEIEAEQITIESLTPFSKE